MVKRRLKIISGSNLYPRGIPSRHDRFCAFNRIAALGGILISLGFISDCRRAPVGDTEAGRIEEAQNFLKTTDLRSLVDDLAEGKAAAKAGIDNKSFRAFIQREIRWSELEKHITRALANHFTASEIRDLAEFQNNPKGKALLEKLPAYQADIRPPLQIEIQRVLAAEEFTRTQLRWDAPQQELSLGPANETVTADFGFLNAGRQAIRFLTITTSCGCTTVKPEKTEYQPGERGTIRVLFARGNLTGVRDEKVYITSDEANHPSITLQMKVTISAPLKITPPPYRLEIQRKGGDQNDHVGNPTRHGNGYYRHRVRPECFLGSKDHR